MKRRKKKIIRIITLLLILTVIILGYNLIKKNKEPKTYKSEYDIALETEMENVRKTAFKAWEMAKKSGKSTDEEIEGFIIERLTNDKVNIDNLYITVSNGKVNVALKHKGFLVEPGYYKAKTNFNEKVEKWTQLVNKRLINVVDGKIGYFKSETDTKIDIVIDDEITEIKDNVFKENVEVDTLVIPSSVKEISLKAFEKAEFRELVFDANVDTINALFKDNSKLEKITFSNKVRTIKGNTFISSKISEVHYLGSANDLISTLYFSYYDAPNHNDGCKLYIYGNLVEEIVIPEGVKKINEYVLMNYTNIKKIKIPSTVEIIGYDAFTGGCKKEIIYDGTKEMWDKIEKAEEWYFAGIECTVYCIDGEIVYKMEER